MSAEDIHPSKNALYESLKKLRYVILTGSLEGFEKASSPNVIEASNWAKNCLNILSANTKWRPTDPE